MLEKLSGQCSAICDAGAATLLLSVPLNKGRLTCGTSVVVRGFRFDTPSVLEGFNWHTHKGHKEKVLKVMNVLESAQHVDLAAKRDPFSSVPEKKERRWKENVKYLCS